MREVRKVVRVRKVRKVRKVRLSLTEFEPIEVADAVSAPEDCVQRVYT